MNDEEKKEEEIEKAEKDSEAGEASAGKTSEVNADGKTPGDGGKTSAGETPGVKRSQTPGVKEAEVKEPSGKFKEVIERIEQLSVLELAELVKELEGRFGVSAAPVAVAAAPAAGGEAAPAEEGKSRLTVMLTESGAQKINVIKAVREINQQLGLKEAKDLVDNPPKEVVKDLPKDEAETAKKKLEAAGAKAELR